MGALAVLCLILAAFIILERGYCRKSNSRFTDLKCESYDPNFLVFKKCKLNVIGRGIIAVNVHVNLLQLPVRDIVINFSFWRLYNGYKPFLYNISCDLCSLLKHPYRLSFEGLVLSAISTRSNLNHTCPFNHDIIVDNLVFNDAFLKTLPLPQGKYKIQQRYGSYGKWTMQVEIFLLREE